MMVLCDFGYLWRLISYFLYLVLDIPVMTRWVRRVYGTDIRQPRIGSFEFVMFELHPRLSQDCIPLGRFPLCRVLLMNESRYPWFILVPEREHIVEIHQLWDQDQIQLIRESSHFAHVLAELFHADKMNIAAIGKLVLQLHLHHVVRYRNDPAWPGLILRRFDPKPYDERTVMGIKQNLKSASLRDFSFFD